VDARAGNEVRGYAVDDKFLMEMRVEILNSRVREGSGSGSTSGVNRTEQNALQTIDCPAISISRVRALEEGQIQNCSRPVLKRESSHFLENL
jgi:hypothetical protein